MCALKLQVNELTSRVEQLEKLKHQNGSVDNANKSEEMISLDLRLTAVMNQSEIK